MYKYLTEVINECFVEAREDDEVIFVLVSAT